MTRVEEARAERAKEQANIDPFGLGVVMPEGFAVEDLDEDDKADVKKEVKAEVKAELKAELSNDVKSEVMQNMENRFSELSAQLAEQKQELRGSLEIDTEDTLQSIKAFENIDEDFQQQNLEKTVKGIMAEVQPQAIPPYPYLQYPLYITPQQLQEEQKKREDEERKKKEEEEQKRKDEEERLKRERSFSTKYKKFKIKVKNHPATKLIVDVFFWILIPFVAIGIFYIAIYCLNNDTINIGKAALDYLSVVWGYILEGFDKIQDFKRSK